MTGYRKNITNWLKLISAVFIILIFMFVLAPQLMKIDAVKSASDKIRETGIESTALWWSEVEIVSAAESNCRNAIQYTKEHASAQKQ